MMTLRELQEKLLDELLVSNRANPGCGFDDHDLADSVGESDPQRIDMATQQLHKRGLVQILGTAARGRTICITPAGIEDAERRLPAGIPRTIDMAEDLLRVLHDHGGVAGCYDAARSIGVTNLAQIDDAVHILKERGHITILGTGTSPSSGRLVQITPDGVEHVEG